MLGETVARAGPWACHRRRHSSTPLRFAQGAVRDLEENGCGCSSAIGERIRQHGLGGCEMGWSSVSGEGSVFQDVVTVRPGESFTAAIEAALDECDAALAVIGPRWLTVTAGSGEPRLRDPGDYVRQELEIALASAKLIVPVLVGGATMPTAEQLPGELRPLGTRQAITLHEETWHPDVDRLARHVDG